MAIKATVTDQAGIVGRLMTDVPSGERAGTMAVAFGDGRTAVVPHERVMVAEDGSYRLDGRFEEFEMLDAGQPRRSDEDTTVPVAREHLSVTRQRRPIGKVLIHKRVDTEEISLDEHLDFDQAEVERVPVERVVDEPPAVRRDGDTVVIPVMEERLVKQLVLVEEIHVRRVRHTKEISEPITLRRERVDIERDRTDPGAEPGEHRPPQ